MPRYKATTKEIIYCDLRLKNVYQTMAIACALSCTTNLPNYLCIEVSIMCFWPPKKAIHSAFSICCLYDFEYIFSYTTKDDSLHVHSNFWAQFQGSSWTKMIWNSGKNIHNFRKSVEYGKASLAIFNTINTNTTIRTHIIAGFSWCSA